MGRMAGAGGRGPPRVRGTSRSPSIGVCSIVVALACLLLATATSGAQPERRSATVTISLMANSVGQPGYKVIIDNFQRVYPDIKVDAQYAPTNESLYQVLKTELAAGNAPDAFVTYPGCGTSISVCVLAHAGHLAPMVNKPWAKRSVPIATSLDKVGKGLY